VVLIRGSIEYEDSYTVGIDVLEKPPASTLNPEDGKSTILQNTGNHLSDYKLA
jgi:hypothetical protein